MRLHFTQSNDSIAPQSTYRLNFPSNLTNSGTASQHKCGVNIWKGRLETFLLLSLLFSRNLFYFYLCRKWKKKQQIEAKIIFSLSWGSTKADEKSEKKWNSFPGRKFKFALKKEKKGKRRVGGVRGWCNLRRESGKIRWAYFTRRVSSGCQDDLASPSITSTSTMTSFISAVHK